jgi:hypothetical protein
MLAHLALAVIGAAACPDNCSLGGTCNHGVCSCEPSFTGPSCSILNLEPADTGRALFRSNASSWGGSVLQVRIRPP